MSPDDSMTLHQHLDALESLLDPRPSLTREIAKCRPRSSPLGATTLPTDSLPPIDPIHSINDRSHSQLTAVLTEVTTLGTEICHRRKESSHIYDLFTRERQELARRILDLEQEVDELKADIAEGSAEREALKGTVHGFESWILRGQKHDWASAKRLSRTSRQKWTNKETEDLNESNMESLLEGITAWLRGWNDIEEGFHNRERERKLRRDERQNMQPGIARPESRELEGYPID
ncbi:hypothetical protein EYZ11_012404 [Aspergillus tanneri]|nr:hypothetical protein EYZ11_012404 [Aspergillus tanneri]